MFTQGFEKTSAKAPAGMGKDLKAAASKAGGVLKSGLKSIGSHLKANRKDYMMGGAAAGALGTAYGANRKKK